MTKMRVGSFMELRVPPVAVALFAALLMALLARSATGLHWPTSVRFGGALFLFATGIAWPLPECASSAGRARRSIR